MKLPCGVCGKIVGTTGWRSDGRRVHTCPHGEPCIGGRAYNVGWCPQCKEHREEFSKIRHEAEFAYQQQITREMRG